MLLPNPLISGILVRRYKRFLADVQAADGSMITVHTPNTGSMLGCSTPGMRVWFSRADNPQRKYPWTWELVEAGPGLLVGVHTGRSNGLVWEALEAGIVPGLTGYRPRRREVAVQAEIKYCLNVDE